MYDEFYQETLSCGGKLKVNKSRWEIEYYYPGVDRRHSGVFFTIYSNEIERFTQALINNFMEYLNIKEKIPSGGDFTTPGEMDMVIVTGRLFQGVSLHSYHDFISNQQELEARLTSFESAKKRAVIIQQALSSI